MLKDKSNVLVLKNFSYLSLIQIGNVIIPLIVIPFVARQISPESFGLLESSRFLCFYFSVIINYSFDATSTRDIVVNRNDKVYLNNIISQTFYAKGLLFLVSTILFIILIYSNDTYTEMRFLLFMTYLINIGFVLFPVWFFQGMEDMAKISIISLVIRVIVGVLTVLIITEPQQYWWYNLLQSFALIMIGLAGVYLVFVKYKIKLISFDFDYIQRLLKEGLPIFVSTFLITILAAMYYQFLQFYSTENELGLFSTSNKIMVSMNGLLLLPFAQAFFPMISKLATENLIQFNHKIKQTAWLLIALTGAAGIAIFILADFIISLVFGAEYADASSSLRILAFLPLLSLLNNLFAFQGLMSLKKDHLFLYIHLFISFVAIGGTWMLKDYLNADVVSYIRIGVEGVLLVITFTAYSHVIRKMKKQHA